MDWKYSSSDSSDDEGEIDYDLCTIERQNSCALPFDPTSLENIILKISDQFNFRVLWKSPRAKAALMVTAGLTVAGSLIGNHYGGKTGAAIGGVVGGACGVGLVIVAMRDVWYEIKSKLSDVFDMVYDYLAGLGFDDYKKAAMFLVQNGSCSKQLALLILQISSNALGQKILSSLTSS
ncbi:hypothetical protein RR46_07392 [Papilio xuthus]|uniref:Uncharacterized protein n=1 Tax=Papilio xuthus TaxID=66420 RepID=A0A194Q2L1_PAPXU|nr:hypothetical protein RR46_07392 [Papilio xuthus]